MTYIYAGQYGPQTLVSVTAGAVNPLPSIPVSVYAVGTTTPIQLYTSRTMATTAANPTTTDTNGNLTFFCAPGDVDIFGNNQRQTVVVNPDPADVATVDGVTLTGPLVLNADPTAALGAATKQYVDGHTAPVTSVFGRTAAVIAATNDYSVGQVTGAAPLASPALSGTPTAPTAAPSTNSTQVGTTAYTDAAVALVSGSAPLVIDPQFGSTTGTITAGHFVPCNCISNAITLTMPTAPADGTRCGVELVAFAAHGVTINTGGLDVFDFGATSLVLAQGVVNQGYVWQYKASVTTWYTISLNAMPVVTMDSRYAPVVAPAFSTPTPTSGTAFTPSIAHQTVLGITCTTSTSIGVTYGPSTGAENTWIPTVVAPVGGFYSLIVPTAYKVIVTGTIADFTFALKEAQ